jgi:hypothetical protein
MLDIEAAHRLALHHLHFNPDQPRVPAGHPDGGQWTREATGGSGQEIASDVVPESTWTPGARYAQARAGGPGSGGRRNVRGAEAEPGQAARLAMAQARANDATARVRQFDPQWRPQPSFYESVEGLIRTYEAEAAEAEARLAELARNGIGPGPFAAGSIPARGPGRDFTPEERAAIDRYGYSRGCHTCGTKDPDTVTGHFVPDHQPPTGLNPLGRPQRLYPQCATCSRDQGLWIIHNR